MQQENQESMKVHQEQEEHEVLLVKNEKLLQIIAEQSQRLRELDQELETQRQKRQEIKKEKDELVEYYVPQFQFLLKENKELSKELNRLNRSTNLDPPSQSICCLSSTSSDGSKEDDERLEKFLSSGEKFDVESKPVNLVRKLEVVKGFVLRDRTKMREKMKSIVEDSKKTENHLRYVIKGREEQLASSIVQFEELKAVFNDVSSKLAIKVDSLKADLEKEKRENLRFRKFNETRPDSADVDIDKSTLPASNPSSSGIADVGDADTASIITCFSSRSVADASNSKTLPSGTVSPMLESVLKYGKSPDSSNQKRKENKRDDGEVSKKLKKSIHLIDLTSQDDEITNESEIETNHRIIELERIVLGQAKNLKAVLQHNDKLQHALNKTNMDGKNVSNEGNFFHNTGMLQDANWITTENRVTCSLPVAPITREDARIFSLEEEYQFASFSEIHYMNASRNLSFLVNKPIGFDNPGRTFCYMNSVVQALSSIPLFAVNLVCGFDSEEGSLLHAMYQTYRHLWVRRPDAWNNNRPSKLNCKEIRSYYAQYHNIKFDPTRQHDAQEFLEDLIGNLESEVSEQCGGVEEENFATRLFRGYIVAPDGSKEYFRNLRLSIEDEGIDTIENALLYHLGSWSPKPVPLDVPGQGNSSFSSTGSANKDENITNPEKTDQRSQVKIMKNEHAQDTSPTGETDYCQMLNIINIDHKAKPASQENPQTISMCEGAVDCRSNQNAGSVLREFFSDTRIARKSIRIYTPDILCVSLNRHKLDYSFNYKILPADDLTIPADLRAPEGMMMPAHYKLMSIVQYVPVGVSAGHYYTYIMSGKGIACMLNDESLTCVEMDNFYLSALDGRSSIFIYARKPENLQRSPGSN